MKLGNKVKLFTIGTIAASAAMVLASALTLSHLNTQYSLREFFPKNHPALKNDALAEKQFSLADNSPFFLILTLKTSISQHWLNLKRIQDLEKITTDLASIRGVDRVHSIANLEMAVESEKVLQVGPVLKNLPEKKWLKYVQDQVLLKPQLISKNLRSVLVIIEPKTANNTSLYQIETEIRKKAQLKNADWDVQVGGVLSAQIHLSQKLHSEVLKFLILSLALFCLMFVAFYKNWQPVIFATMGLIVTNLTSLAWLSILGIHFTVLLSTVPIITSISFVSLCIHTLHLWAEKKKALSAENSVSEKWTLSKKTLRELLLPNFLGSLTTAIGFLTLALTDIPAIRNYGIVIAALVMWVWLISQILLLAFLYLMNPIARSWNHSRAGWMLVINRFRIPILLISVVVSVAFGSSIKKINFSAPLFDDLPKNESTGRAETLIDKQFGGTVALDISLIAANADAWKNPAHLSKLKKSLQMIRKISGVGSVIGVTDFFDKKLPDKKAQVAEMFFLFSLAPENPLRHFISANFKESRIAIRLQDLPSLKIEAIRKKVEKIILQNDSSLKIRQSGLAVNSHTINQDIAHKLVYGFWQSLFIIGCALVLIFRSLRWGLVACIPNLITPAILIGTLVIFQTPVKPGVAVVFSIALGLAFNNTVYLLSRLKRLQSELNMQKLPLRRAFLEEGNPCISESMIMFVGFFIFLASEFKLNQTFGLYMVLSILVGAFADLIFLPAFLRQFSFFLWKKPVAQAAKLNLEPQKIAASLIPIFLILTLFSPKLQADEATEILKKARLQLNTKTDESKVVLKIIESNGEIKSREMNLQTLRIPHGLKAIIRITAPADIKGTSLLASIENGEQLQWLYLPSSKQVRRIATGKKSGGILGSELNADDLDPTSIPQAKLKILRKDKTQAVLEIIPKKGSSEYTRVLTSVSLPDSLPQKIEYLKGKKVMKTVEFKDYKKINDKIYRAQKIQIRNIAKKRGTDLEFTEIKVNTNLSAKDFTPESLKGNW